MKLGGAICVPYAVFAPYAESIHSGLSSPMPSQNRMIASRVACSLFRQDSVRNCVPISARMSASISSVNLPRASPLVMPAESVVVVFMPGNSLSFNAMNAL